MDKQIIQAVADYLGLAAEDIEKGNNLQEDLGLGPVELNDLLHHLSEKFGVVFNPEETEDLQKMDDLIVLIEDNLLE